VSGRPSAAADVDAVWTRLSPDDPATWPRYGAYLGGPDYLTGTAQVALVVLDDAAYAWLAAADARTAVVEADPWLRPA